MSTRERVIEQVSAAIDAANERLPGSQEVGKSMDTALFGEDARLDSLALLELLVNIQQNIETEFGLMMSLPEGISEDDSPFRTVGRMVDYITEWVEKESQP
jgi:acyl carrier protein